MNKNLQALGYKKLITRYNLEIINPWCCSWLSSQRERKTHIENNLTTEIYAPSYDPGNNLGDHLTFALKYEGVNLEILSALDNYRELQNYVGQSIAPGREIIHFAAPKPENINSMMTGWVQCAQNMLESEISPVVTAAVIGYGFVFLHPFDDGNGRLHRYLIHYALGKKHFSPPGLIFPVSATMLKNMPQYDGTLEHFSRELMQHVEYTLDDDGEMTVSNDTAQFYRYQDMTFQSEGLFEFIRDTIEDELNTELEYLNIFDQTKKRMREIVDMPDRKLDLFIRICLQNHGRISKNKTTQFSMLTNDEINKLSSFVQDIIKKNKDI